MALLRRAALLAALLPVLGCQRSPTMLDLGDGSIAVHAILLEGADSVTVLVARPANVGDDWQPTPTRPVADAQVRLVHGADTTWLTGRRACLRTMIDNPHPAVPDTGCYTAHVSGGVRAGETYELLVDVPGVSAIRGMTRVPVQPQILAPSASAEPPVLHVRTQNLPPTAITTRWAATAPQTLVELRFVPERTDCMVMITQPDQGFGTTYVSVIGRDTASIAASSVQCGQALTDRYTAQLVITAYDASYSVYLRANAEAIRQPRASVGITGAYGVFGAAASSAVPVVLSVQ